MTSPNTPLASGYSDVPAGHVATVVTCLEMRARPVLREVATPAGITLERFTGGDLAAYRDLFRKVGSDWLWFSRLLMADDALAAILRSDSVEIFVIRDGHEAIGMLELDFSQPQTCELSFLGLTAAATGKGLGRWVMNQAIARAWSTPLTRFWVHTCSFDHPAALSFYIRSGFSPYAFQVEVKADPRLSGHLPESAAPLVPLIRP